MSDLDTKAGIVAKNEKTSALPALVSKKWFGNFYGIARATGYTPAPRLFSMVLTAEVLEKAGIDPDTAKSPSKRTFTATETNALYRALNLI